MKPFLLVIAISILNSCSSGKLATDQGIPWELAEHRSKRFVHNVQNAREAFDLARQQQEERTAERGVHEEEHHRKRDHLRCGTWQNEPMIVSHKMCHYAATNF